MPNIKPISDLRNYTAVISEVASKLNEAEISIREEGTISADELEAELGVSD